MKIKEKESLFEALERSKEEEMKRIKDILKEKSEEIVRLKAKIDEYENPITPGEPL